MKTLTEHLAQYAAYHLDTRNVATHWVGVPMIMLAVTILLARPVWPMGGLPVSPAVLVSLASALFYLRLDLRFGLVMAAWLTAFVAIAHGLAAQPTALWLTAGVSLFVVGWAIQLLGHHFEGRKPAFVDDIMGLLIGPLFLVVKLAFALGWRLDLKADIERRLVRPRTQAQGAPA
ncbi:MAG TPA: Mpo1-like protein [Hydrogenophaga sp.]|nr:Mpo1-like protein [Hydrogenophaga sp.]